MNAKHDSQYVYNIEYIHLMANIFFMFVYLILLLTYIFRFNLADVIDNNNS